MSEDIGVDSAMRDPDLSRIGGIMVCVSSTTYHTVNLNTLTILQLPSQSDLEKLTGDKRCNLFRETQVPDFSKEPLKAYQDLFRAGRTTGITISKDFL